jgi:iron(III) transport system permease protein
VLAVLVGRTDIAGRRLLALLLAIALFLPLYVQNAAWQAGFGQQGWWEMTFSQLGAAPLLYQWRGAIWIHAMAAVPWVTLIVLAALRQVEPQLEEAALVEGSPLQVLLNVSLRRSWAAIVAAGLWIGVAVAGEITVTDMWQLRTYAEEIYIGFALGDTIEEVTLHVLPGMLFVGLFALAALLALAQLAPRSTQAVAHTPITFALGRWRWRWPLTLLAFGLVALLVGVPLANLGAKLGIVVEEIDGARQRSWSLWEAANVLARSLGEFRHEVFWSLVMGSLAASCALLVAIPLAWLAKAGFWQSCIVLGLLAVLLAIPGPIIGLGLITIFNQSEAPWLHFLYDRSIAAPTIALVIRALPLVTLITWHALSSVPVATLELAALEGAGWWQRLWRVALPQRKGAVAAAWLVGVAIAIGDLSASFLVLPPGISPLSRRIFEEAHYGVDNRLAGLTLTAIGLMTLIALAVAALVQVQTAIAAGRAREL